MKTTENFKKAIQDHLNKLAEKDSLFAETLKKKNKNIDDCITYILNQVKASGCNGFADEEIFGMAVHFYDEDYIKPGSKIKNYNVVVNHKPEVLKVKKEVKKVIKPDFVTENQISMF
ncbi:PcfK-like protein [Polaribacter phage Freya_1]|uniref:PcfK-like protein n=1 Tax=Polaribacter phage Freya_1 TaxID=2745662 RepID=A0A8E4ZFY6_9CAUD|nr:PcfK-like protein [Polaribacter phage Freya_1]QQV90995.1 PcfK-like protein [Polaribacter phage Freya_2]QQV91063.1 PcfK-like protein [Polaribacter phage Freya_3]QQV91131.1 PcfK-like protein [Polaribacter phage Freya_4]QQV91206.1 PcfK-like protein [Polaribacter phage Freya_8]QQV91283.1 PcfK-like protein [Polaribacter phage Freya_9]QQV91361.1 PcfK-like protein [Polaribacter phage Freya_10]QYV99940.1 PcfK-like protein [Polaribacter phage Freya_5]QYW00011.1 PcfK-like protein [Polaribacter pha